jgi:hypothetical protein
MSPHDPADPFEPSADPQPGADPGTDELIRLLIGSWVALRAGTLAADRQALLDRERPDWQCEAANLIAEGLLGYVTVEVVEPDLAHDREADPDDDITADDFADRLKAHLLDFTAYRAELPRARRMKTH